MNRRPWPPRRDRRAPAIAVCRAFASSEACCPWPVSTDSSQECRDGDCPSQFTLSAEARAVAARRISALSRSASAPTLIVIPRAGGVVDRLRGRPSGRRAGRDQCRGWLGTGCASAAAVNGALFRRGAAFTGPTLWLYGRDDPYYPITH